MACVHQIQQVHACVWLVHRAYGSCKCSKPIFNFIFWAQRWVNEIPLLHSNNISPNFPINLPCGHIKKKNNASHVGAQLGGSLQGLRPSTLLGPWGIWWYFYSCWTGLFWACQSWPKNSLATSTQNWQCSFRLTCDKAKSFLSKKLYYRNLNKYYLIDI